MKKIKVEEFNNWTERIQKEDLFLDIGCWDGSLVKKLIQDKKCNAFGLDIDRKKLALASPEIKNKLKYGDATRKIPFKNKFDWILISEVIEHVESDEKLLENISSSLKTGGHLILTTPRSVTGFQIWDPAWVRWKFGGPRHYHFSIDELDKKLAEHNIIIEDLAIGGSFLWVMYRWINVLLRYGLKLKTSLKFKGNSEGFCDIKLIAKKIK